MWHKLIVHALQIHYREEYGYLSLTEGELAYRLGYEDDPLIEDVKDDVIHEMTIRKRRMTQ